MLIPPAALTALFLQCAPDVSPITLNALIGVESSGDPYVVANVTDETSHRFKSKDEAVTFLNELERKGKSYSAGLMQIYSGNFKGYGLNNETVFEHCTNIKTGAAILKQCFMRAERESQNQQEALRKAFSCYYSNNFTRGFKLEKDGNSYVQKIEMKAAKQSITVPAIQNIADSNGKQLITTEEGEGHKNNREAIISLKKDSGLISNDSWDIFGDY